MVRPAELRPADLARLVGVSAQRVNGWLRGEHDPRPDLLPAIADILGVSVSALMGSEPLRPFGPTGLKPLRGEEMGKVKVLGIASAGIGSESRSDDECLDVPIDMARQEYSGLKVEGDSMLPLLHPGDIAIFRDHPSERIGLIFAVRRQSDSCILVKRLVYPEGGWALESINPVYDLERVSAGDQLLGYLVGYVRLEGSKKTTVHDPGGLRG